LIFYGFFIKGYKMEQLKTTLNVGKLVSLEWKLGVAISSSQFNSVNAPFVTLLLKVSDNNNAITSHSFELSASEFNDFAKNLNDIQALLKAL